MNALVYSLSLFFGCFYLVIVWQLLLVDFYLKLTCLISVLCVLIVEASLENGDEKVTLRFLDEVKGIVVLGCDGFI